MVRVIRMERPLVIVSRFSGTARDGHGQHQAAGVLTQEAFRAAADPKRFPEQLEEGLRPWQALKLFAGARSGDEWSVEVDPGVYDPVLGTSYQTFARLGLSFQRSQNGGRFVAQPGAAPVHYARITAPAPVTTPGTPTRTINTANTTNAAGATSTTAKPAGASTTKPKTLAEAANSTNGGGPSSSTPVTATSAPPSAAGPLASAPARRRPDSSC